MIPIILSVLYITASLFAASAIVNWLGQPLGVLYGVIGAFIAALYTGQDGDDLPVAITRFVMLMVAWPVTVAALIKQAYDSRGIKFRIKVR